MSPKAIGLLRSGTIMKLAIIFGQVSDHCGNHLQQNARMLIAPLNNPPTPSPATALPTIRAVLVGAVAHISDLEVLSNMQHKSWVTIFTLFRIWQWQS
jgi:hypothetical protein